MSTQGIIDCKGTETRQCFSRMLVMAKKLNGITANIRCVSSKMIVLKVKLTRLIAAHANKKDGEKRRSPTRVLFFAS